jgi:hypothetical protein
VIVLPAWVAIVVVCGAFEAFMGQCPEERRIIVADYSTCHDLVRSRQYGDGECREVWNDIEFRSVCGGDNVPCEPLPRDYRPTPKNPALIEQR